MQERLEHTIKTLTQLILITEKDKAKVAIQADIDYLKGHVNNGMSLLEKLQQDVPVIDMDLLNSLDQNYTELDEKYKAIYKDYVACVSRGDIREAEQIKVRVGELMSHVQDHYGQVSTTIPQLERLIEKQYKYRKVKQIEDSGISATAANKHVEIDEDYSAAKTYLIEMQNQEVFAKILKDKLVEFAQNIRQTVSVQNKSVSSL